MNNNLPPFKVFSGTKSQYLAEEICKELGVELGKMNIQHFADGEIEEVLSVGGFKARNGDVGFGIELLCDAPCQAV